MANVAKSSRRTLKAAVLAADHAAEAVRTTRAAIKTVKKAGSQAKVVATKVMDRVSGREAARKQRNMAVAAGVATATVVAGVAVARVRQSGKRHKRGG